MNAGSTAHLSLLQKRMINSRNQSEKFTNVSLFFLLTLPPTRLFLSRCICNVRIFTHHFSCKILQAHDAIFTLNPNFINFFLSQNLSSQLTKTLCLANNRRTRKVYNTADGAETLFLAKNYTFNIFQIFQAVLLTKFIYSLNK